MKKFATIALVGAPNSGKSTLTNSLLGQKLSIVSPKVQTTRNVIKAIIVENQTQIILLDTPGVFIPRSDKILERVIVKSAWQGIRSADFACFIIDAARGLDRENARILEEIKKNNLNPTIIINKIDIVKKSILLDIINDLSKKGFTEILMVSAKTMDGIENLKKILIEKCPEGEWQYDEENITDAAMQSIACEITREKLFLYLNQELPYSVTVKNDSYKIDNDGKITIHQTILVLKESQKAIIIGKKGSLIKKIGYESRRDFSTIAQAKVALYLFVKVKKDWMNDSQNYENKEIDKK